MQATLVVWWLFLSCSCVVFGAEFDWHKLKKKLNDSGDKSAAKQIAENWSERLLDFFEGLGKNSWLEISQHLSLSQINSIKRKEFDSMTPELLENILYWMKVCPTTDISFWTEKTIGHISPECLHDILKEAEETAKLGKLWENINWPAVYYFTDKMKPSLRKIDLSDFNFMKPDVLKVISRVSGICSALGVKFWTEDTIEGITADCLHEILKEAKGTIQLVKFWVNISPFVINQFTDKMRLSLRKIDLRDFQFMKPDVLKAILESAPEFCSALGVKFWTEDTIEGISKDCLYELLTKYEVPAKLRTMWNNVRISCCDILKKTDFSLDSVHPDDWVLANEWIGKAIEIRPHVCQTLSTSFWNEEKIKYMTADCLYHALHETRRPFALGRLWGHVPPLVVEDFSRSMLDRLKNVAGSDFQYMPSIILQSIFSSKRPLDYLPHPRSEIILSAQASEVSMVSLEFAVLVMFAPSVSGQLLWYSTKLPENVLSYFGQYDLLRELKLTIPGEAELDWKGLFTKLERKYSLDGRAKPFAKMIQSISEDSAVHFCATLLDLDEYLSLTWLHSNMSEKCRKALPFAPDQAVRLFSTLDLSKENYSWDNMLREYSNDDWALLSQSKRVAAFIGKDCKFWETIETGGWSNVFVALDSLVLKSILLECVMKIPGILANNLHKIPLLADDAFSKHMIGQLPCHINRLSPAQIALLSSKTFKNIDGPSAKEISQHVLSGVVLDDLKALDFRQFKSLYKSQWVFVPEEIRNDALSWWLDSNLSQALSFMANLNTSGPYSSRIILGQEVDLFKPIEDTLSLVLSVYRDGYNRIPESNLASLINSIRSSTLLPVFVKVIEGYTLLKPTVICLVRDAKELRDYNRKAFKEMGIYKTKLALQHNQKSGFDHPEMIRLLKKTPELFAAPSARVSSQGTIDNGGVVRSLTSQLLADIERDLVVPYAGFATLESEFVAKMKMVDQVKSKVGATDVGSGCTKFVWGTSREMGLIVGLAFGKALQLDIKLPFALGRMFYELLIDTSDKAIRQYYLETYGQEIVRFRQGIIDLFGMGDLKKPLQILTRPDGLRFTQLSTRADSEEAKIDMATKTNLWGCSDTDCYEHVDQLQDSGFVENYINDIVEMVHNEFKGFIHEVVRGLGMALPPVKEFKNLPIPFLRPFADFLPQLLNANQISADQLIAKINIASDDDFVTFAGRGFPVSRVLFAFIRSLDKNQPSHLLGVWTGSTTISLEDIKLNVMFIKPDTQTSSIKFDFCNFSSELAVSNRPAIASGSEYKALFTKFIKELVGEAESHEPDCPDGGLEFYPTRVATCAQSLMVYTKSLHQMFGSLVDLLNTPLAAIRN